MLLRVVFVASTATLPLMIQVLALAPHPFWKARLSLTAAVSPRSRSSPLSTITTTSTRLHYFDDCERRGLEQEWEPTPSDDDAWITARAHEKQQAMEQLLGYTAASAAKRSFEQVEEETLQWALDTNVIWAGDEDIPKEHCKYSSISDLIMAPSQTMTTSLAFLWQVLADELKECENEVTSDSKNSKKEVVLLITFPQAVPLWDYDVMVTMLHAIRIAKPLLPSNIELQLDLFHPDYKHAPRMWSPEKHAPFPTVGLKLRVHRNHHQQQVSETEESKEESTEKSTEESAEESAEESLVVDIDETRSKLKALFDAMDADDKSQGGASSSSATTVSPELALAACQEFLPPSQFLGEWMVEPNPHPYQVYQRLWEAASQLLRQPKQEEEQSNSIMLVVPLLDSYTTHRVGVTVNAALQKLDDTDTPVRIENVYHPCTTKSTSATTRNSPYSMIQLVRTTPT